MFKAGHAYRETKWRVGSLCICSDNSRDLWGIGASRLVGVCQEMWEALQVQMLGWDHREAYKEDHFHIQSRAVASASSRGHGGHWMSSGRVRTRWDTPEALCVRGAAKKNPQNKKTAPEYFPKRSTPFILSNGSSEEKFLVTPSTSNCSVFQSATTQALTLSLKPRERRRAYERLHTELVSVHIEPSQIRLSPLEERPARNPRSRPTALGP